MTMFSRHLLAALYLAALAPAPRERMAVLVVDDPPPPRHDLPHADLVMLSPRMETPSELLCDTLPMWPLPRDLPRPLRTPRAPGGRTALYLSLSDYEAIARAQAKRARKNTRRLTEPFHHT